MASLKAMVASANKLVAANDFAEALKICEQGLLTAEGNMLFPLVSMHGFCSMSLGKFAKAEKSFNAAKLLEGNPQMHQKNIKFLADTYLELGKWHEHANELTCLYKILKEYVIKILQQYVVLFPQLDVIIIHGVYSTC
jgi:tetratricopeptide (TPR) repeat protein